MEYLIRTNAIGGMTEDQFFRFCEENDSIQFERTHAGDIVVTEPTGLETERFNVSITSYLFAWNLKTRSGHVFGNNGGFTLPNSAVRCPDVAFITNEKYARIPVRDRKKFAHVCPDFVIELLPETDHKQTLQEKMKEWMDNGCQLAWLIDPFNKETMIYDGAGRTATMKFNETLDGGKVLPGFTLRLEEIF